MGAGGSPTASGRGGRLEIPRAGRLCAPTGRLRPGEARDCLGRLVRPRSALPDLSGPCRERAGPRRERKGWLHCLSGGETWWGQRWALVGVGDGLSRGRCPSPSRGWPAHSPPSPSSVGRTPRSGRGGDAPQSRGDFAAQRSLTPASVGPALPGFALEAAAFPLWGRFLDCTERAHLCSLPRAACKEGRLRLQSSAFG